jgi:hypothetical protein
MYLNINSEHIFDSTQAPVGIVTEIRQQHMLNLFDGIVFGWSFSKIVSGSRALPPRWPPQCSCVVIESSFDPGERLQAPGSQPVLELIIMYITNNSSLFHMTN